MAQIFVVTSGNGGAGKSYVAASLGVSLAVFQDKKVLIIDLNRPFGVLDSLLSVDEKRLFDLGDALYGRCSIENAVINVNSRVHLICAAQRFDENTGSYEFKKFLEGRLTQYDYIIIDSAPELLNSLNTAFVCGGIGIVVCTLDLLSIKGASFAAEALKRCKSDDSFLLLNRVSLSKKSDLPNLDEIIDSTGLQLIGVLPADNSFLSSFFSKKTDNKNSNIFSAFLRISSRLCGKPQPLPNLFKL